MIEGYLKDFTSKDFLQKNIYAIPYGDKYSLVTSIDYRRKIGARSGIVGKDASIRVQRERRPYRMHRYRP